MHKLEPMVRIPEGMIIQTSSECFRLNTKTQRAKEYLAFIKWRVLYEDFNIDDFTAVDIDALLGKR